ncbi:ParB/RepB/Spo0J family partition protein [Streptomyces sp. WAC08241]|uniref:ParB/RepB/Spo0J family partition protein n=1 Tax=Streptomyces sp. WAC08241 TaxID=2487421 RepID=UPI000F78E382|nr:ParB/RepB/Spo0J family partition protein [Streptomyces sp. WAC08241]RSS35230.1 ParB/RepB/Spo0J family partition protein [Streptomyces sp. WAC08241]
MAGQRVALSSLAGAKVETVPGITRPALVHVAPSDVAPTPLNPRIDFDKETLVELGTSMKSGQLAPCVAIPRAKYLGLFPEHAEELPSCKYVMAAGERRWRAALEVGLPTLDLHIRQDIAETPAKFLAAVLAENIERKNFNYIEEAFGLQRMLEMSGGNQTDAATRLSKSRQWFSQRIGILRLSPEMQQAVRDGELTAFREMRRYAAMPPDQQMAAWQADLEKARRSAESPSRPPAAPVASSGKETDDPGTEPGTTGVYTAVYTPATPPASPATQPEQSQPEREADQPPPAPEARHHDVMKPSSTPTSAQHLAPVPDPRPEPDEPAQSAEPSGAEPWAEQPPRVVGLAIPWSDGAAVADIIVQRMTPEQRQILLTRLQAAQAPSATG